MGLSKLTERAAELRKEMRDTGKALLLESLGEFFGKHPEAKSVVWTQYSPHFNDGDACTFSMNEPELNVYVDKMAEDVRAKAGVVAAEDGDEGEDDEERYSYGESSPGIRALQAICGLGYYKAEKTRDCNEAEASLLADWDALRQELNKAEDTMEQLFGDGYLIRCTREGTDVEEYDHD
jgi:hypothetical protein